MAQRYKRAIVNATGCGFDSQSRKAELNLALFRATARYLIFSFPHSVSACSK